MAIIAATIKKARRLLLVNLTAYVLVAMTGIVLINDAIDFGYDTTGGNVGYYYRPVSRAAVSAFTNLFVTMAGVVGIAAALPGIRHVRSWSQGSLPPAAHSGSMAWLLTLLALGLAIKEVTLGAHVHDHKMGSSAGGKADYLYLAVPRALLLGCLSVLQLSYLRTIFHTGA